MLVDVDDCISVLRCPRTLSALRRRDRDTLVSHDCGTSMTYEYRIIRGKPMRIDFSGSVLSEDAVMNSAAKSPVERHHYSGVSGGIKKLLSPEKEDTRENVRRIITDLEGRQKRTRLLIVGGGSIGQGRQGRQARLFLNPGRDHQALSRRPALRPVPAGSAARPAGVMGTSRLPSAWHFSRMCKAT